jgi:hypothetical protein
MEEYKVLVVVDLQNCFIQGGSLGNQNIVDLKKFIELVQNIDEKIAKNSYDLVVFSKDSHPVNHSSLFDKVEPENGVYTYHCRNSKYDCLSEQGKDNTSNATYMSTISQDLLKDFLCQGKTQDVKKSFYEKKEAYDKDEYNFYNPELYSYFNKMIGDEIIRITDLQNRGQKEQAQLHPLYNAIVKKDDENFTSIYVPTNVKSLITQYNNDKNLDTDSKKYLQTIQQEYEKENIQGLDLNYLFYNTSLKEIIYKLNGSKSKSEIGIKTKKILKIYQTILIKITMLIT